MPQPLDDVSVLLAQFPCHERPAPAALATLSDEETERASRFHFERDRVVYQSVRTRLREILGDLLGIAPAKVEFEYGSYGKPFLSGGELQFNASHAGGRALIAVARERRVGVDLEPVTEKVGGRRRPRGFERELARRAFSKREIVALDRLSVEDQRAAFYRLWTRKEAFIKADGRGLAVGLERFAVSLEADRAELLWTSWDPHEPSRWTLKPLTVAPGFEAALAVEGSGWALRRL